MTKKIKLKDICRLINGRAYKQDELLDEGKYPVLRVGNFFSDKNFYYSDLELEEDKYCDNGDLLFAWSASFGPKVWDGGKVIYHYHIWKMELSDKVDRDYLYFYLYHLSERIKSEGHGGIMIHTTKAEMEEREFFLPELAAQKRIVEQLAKISAVINTRKQQLKQLDELVKARFVELFGEPISNPKMFPVKPLKDISVLITNGNTPKGGSENYLDAGIVFLRSQNVWRNNIVLDDVAYIDEKTHASMKKSSVHYKDILITKTGRINTENSSLGRAALYKGEDDSANINGHVYLVRLDDTVVPEYVVTILTGEAYRRYIRKVCVGGIDKRQINLDQVEEFPIILPPKEQQEQFAAFVAQVDKSKLLLERKSLNEVQRRVDNLIQKYFS